MKTRFILLCLVLGAVAWVVFLPRSPDRESIPVPVPLPTETEPVQERVSLGETLTEDLSSSTLQGYGSATFTPFEDLGLIFECIEMFHTHLKGRTELPAGSNRELTTALLGANNDRIRFIHPDFPYVNEQGELVDRWRSPLFFHFVDGSVPEIRSAGPDRKMWTDDDLLWSN